MCEGVRWVERRVVKVKTGDPAECVGEAFGMLVQYHGASGEVRDYRDIIKRVKEQKGWVVMAADILSLVLLQSPGSLGADVAIGSTQRFGVPLSLLHISEPTRPY